MPLHVFKQNTPKITIYAGDHIFVENSSTKLTSSVSTVDHDGYIVFSALVELKL